MTKHRSVRPARRTIIRSKFPTTAEVMATLRRLGFPARTLPRRSRQAK